MGRFLVAECGKAGRTFPSASLLDLRTMPECTSAVKTLADRLLDTPTEKAEIRKVIARAPAFGAGNTKIKPFSDYRDLGAFARLLGEDPKIQDPALKAAAGEVLRVLQERLVREEAHEPRRDGALEGLSIYLPLTGFDYGSFGMEFPYHTDRREYEALYRGLDFVKETGWDRVVDRYAEKATA